MINLFLQHQNAIKRTWWPPNRIELGGSKPLLPCRLSKLEVENAHWFEQAKDGVNQRKGSIRGSGWSKKPH
jgi:hypothetical protein